MYHHLSPGGSSTVVDNLCLMCAKAIVAAQPHFHTRNNDFTPELYYGRVKRDALEYYDFRNKMVGTAIFDTCKNEHEPLLCKWHTTYGTTMLNANEVAKKQKKQKNVYHARKG